MEKKINMYIPEYPVIQTEGTDEESQYITFNRNNQPTQVSQVAVLATDEADTYNSLYDSSKINFFEEKL